MLSRSNSALLKLADREPFDDDWPVINSKPFCTMSSNASKLIENQQFGF
jgi:hypothetical protein